MNSKTPVLEEIWDISTNSSSGTQGSKYQTSKLETILAVSLNCHVLRLSNKNLIMMDNHAQFM